MGPPTEQLIRHYLNRLSVAAQGRLNRDDRRALLARTRGYIEHATGLPGPATAKEVAAVLSRLGDPTLVVAKEMERLAEERGDAAAPPPRKARLSSSGRRAPGRLSASWHWPARPGNVTDLHAMLTFGRPDAVAASGTDVQVTRVEAAGGQTAPGGSVIPASGLEALGLIGPDRDDAGLAGPNGVTPEPIIGQQPGSGPPASPAVPVGPQRPSWPHDPAIRRDDVTAESSQQKAQDQAAGTSPAADALAPASAGGGEAAGGFPGAEPAPETAAPTGGDAGDSAVGGYGQGLAAGPDPGEEPAAGEESVGPTSGGAVRGETAQLAAAGLPVADVTVAENAASQPARSSGLRRMSTAVVAWSRDKTLESVATILLGIGGLIFPPIWLLGAMVALASRIWDGRDKWVGLATPVLLTIVGTAAGVILAGSPSSLGHDVHVGWVSADIASRISAVLGAAYLAWRSVQGPRPAAAPPWDKTTSG